MYIDADACFRYNVKMRKDINLKCCIHLDHSTANARSDL